MSRFGCVSTRAWQTTLKRLTGGGESSLPSRRRWTVCGSSTTQRSDEGEDGAAGAAVRDGEDVCAAGTSAEETAGEVEVGKVFDAAGDRAVGEDAAGGDPRAGPAGAGGGEGGGGGAGDDPRAGAAVAGGGDGDGSGGRRGAVVGREGGADAVGHLNRSSATRRVAWRRRE